MTKIDPRWLEDEEIQREISANRARRSLIIGAVTWTPLFAAAGGALLFFGFDVMANDGDRGGTWFMLVVLSILTFLFGTQSVQALRDLSEGKRELAGRISRRWARSDSLVMRSHYIRIEGKILRGDKMLLAPYLEGDTVVAAYYPHSGVLASIERVEPPRETAAAAE